MNATLTSTQRNALAVLASHLGDDYGLKPRAVRRDTLLALTSRGLIERKWYTVGRLELFRLTDAGRAALGG